MVLVKELFVNVKNSEWLMLNQRKLKTFDAS